MIPKSKMGDTHIILNSSISDEAEPADETLVAAPSFAKKTLRKPLHQSDSSDATFKSSECDEKRSFTPQPRPVTTMLQLTTQFPDLKRKKTFIETTKRPPVMPNRMPSQLSKCFS